jgi:hypothetical protein
VPHYDELSVRKLYPHFKGDKQFTQYFPDTYPKNKGPPRQYFFDVLNTVYPDYLRQIMAHANSERMSADAEQNRTSSIAISQFWEEELKAMPYLSRKCSRFSFFFVLSDPRASFHRTLRQDCPPAQVRLKEDHHRQEAEEARTYGHDRPVQGVKEEAAIVVTASTANTSLSSDSKTNRRVEAASLLTGAAVPASDVRQAATATRS